MIVAVKRKVLNRSKRAIFLLKILIAVTGCIAFTVTMMAKKNIFFAILSVVLAIFAPLMTLKGAFQVQEILEQRENFIIHFVNI